MHKKFKQTVVTKYVLINAGIVLFLKYCNIIQKQLNIFY